MCVCVCVGIQSELIVQFTKKHRHQNDKDSINQGSLGNSNIISVSNYGHSVRDKVNYFQQSYKSFSHTMYSKKI